MTNRTLLALVLLGFFAGCGDSDSLPELQKKNEDLTARVKTLENQTLEIDKKIIQHQQALQLMHQRIRDMEAEVDRARMGAR
jgi:chaperonin cofactor prefoldin